VSFDYAFASAFDQPTVTPQPAGAWPYATVDELANALRTRATDENRAVLQACLDAAATEIDHDLDRFVDEPLVEPFPALVVRVNVDRAVEWFKATDASMGAAGSVETGVVMPVPAALTPPADSFFRHAVRLTPFKQQWGLA